MQRSKIISVLVSILLFLLISSCKQQAKTQNTNQNNLKLLEDKPEDFNYLWALKLMFDSPDIVFSENLGIETEAVDTSAIGYFIEGHSICDLSLPVPPILDNEFFDTDFYECTQIILAEQFMRDGVEHMMLLTETIYDTSHQGGARISGAIFKKKDQQWVLDFAQRNFIEAGDFGGAPFPREFIQVGENRVGILFTDPNITTGILYQTTFLISDIDRQFKMIFFIESALGQIDYSSKSTRTEWAWKYESIVTMEEQAAQDWYDIKVVTNGTKGMEEVDETVWYKWDGETYVIRDDGK